MPAAIWVAMTAVSGAVFETRAAGKPARLTG
jgi:hypothetical protein